METQFTKIVSGESGQHVGVRICVGNRLVYAGTDREWGSQNPAVTNIFGDPERRTTRNDIVDAIRADVEPMLGLQTFVNVGVWIALNR